MGLENSGGQSDVSVNVRDINQVAIPAEIKTQWTVVNFGIRPESRRKDQEDGRGLKHELFLR